MKKREMEKLLKEAGFWKQKNGTRHEIWTNGKERIALSHGSSNVAPCTLKSFLSKVRRAKKELASA